MGLNLEFGWISLGVFLEWKLIFYGMGFNDSVFGDDEDEGEDNDFLDVDIDL